MAFRVPRSDADNLQRVAMAPTAEAYTEVCAVTGGGGV
jgi:hypothetical protein